MRRTVPLTAILAFAAVLGLGANAYAAGLVVLDETGRATRLAQLETLNLEISLTETDAHVVERRQYVLIPAEGEQQVRFYRTIGDEVDESSLTLSVSGVERDASLLIGSEAMSRQVTLLREMRAPGVLRGLGGRLAQTAPIELGPEGYVTFEVRVEYREALRPWDTLRALTAPIDWQERAVSFVDVSVEAVSNAPIRALYSPFHELDTQRFGELRASGTYRHWDVCTTNDLVVMLSTGTGDVHLDVMPFRYGDEEGGFFMALLTPSDAGESMPRDLVFVIDTSGSMDGEKMKQAREALRNVIAGLSPKDRFTVVEFDSNVKVLSDEAQSARAGFVAEADEFVTDLVADGATNLSGALEAGFDALPFTRDRPRYVVVLTDGQPTEGETDTEAILELVKRRNEVGARVFAFGIGNDVNTVLLDRLALDSGGDAIYIRPGQSVAGPVEEFFASIASAALVDPQLDSASFGGLSLVYPEAMPDLYAHQTLAVVGRYESGGTGEIVLRGTRGSGQVAMRYEVNLPEFSTQNAHVPRIWATRHVGTLLHRIKLGDTDPELPVEATAIANRFGVVTEFTNFALDEDGNAVMRYTNVPLDTTGSVAVDTSASLDGYQNSGSASAGFEDFVRYASDRALPIYEGWFTDTSVESARWIDLHFGSELYLALAARESSLGITNLLGVSRDVAFEFHGREIRVSDPDVEGDVPPEAVSVPVADPPAATQAVVRLLAEEPAADPRTATPTEEPAEDGAAEKEPPVYAENGCSTSSGRLLPWMTVLFMACVAAIRRRATR